MSLAQIARENKPRFQAIVEAYRHQCFQQAWGDYFTERYGWKYIKFFSLVCAPIYLQELPPMTVEPNIVIAESQHVMEEIST